MIWLFAVAGGGSRSCCKSVEGVVIRRGLAWGADEFAGKGYVGSHAEAKDQLVCCLHGEGTGPSLGHPRVHGEGKLAVGLVS